MRWLAWSATTLATFAGLAGCGVERAVGPDSPLLRRLEPPGFVARLGAESRGTDGAWGVAVAPDGTIYASDPGSAGLVAYDDGGHWRGVWRAPRFDHMADHPVPGRVAVGPDGRVTFMDQRQWVITRFDPATGAFALVGEVGAQRSAYLPQNALAFDGVGRLFALDAARRRVQVYDADGAFLSEWGHRSADSTGFERPAALAAAPDGSICVVDAELGRVQFYTPDGRPLRTWGQAGRAAGQLDGPSGVAFDAAGHLLVMETGYRARLQVFTLTGEFLRGWDLSGYPVALALTAGGEILVADPSYYARNILRFDAEGHFQTSIGYIRHDGLGEIEYWPRVVVDAYDDFYALDIYAGRIQRFGPDGFVLGDWRTHDEWGGTTRPRFLDLAVGPDRTLFVADQIIKGVVRYRRGGSLPDTLRLVDGAGGSVVPRTIMADRQGRFYVVGDDRDRLFRYSGEGDFDLEWSAAPDDSGGAGSFGEFAWDAVGHLWNLTGDPARVEMYDTEGALHRRFRLPETGIERVVAPRAIAFNPAGDLCLADGWGGRLEVFSPQGRFLARWYLSGGDSRVTFPIDLAWDSRGQLYVSDLDAGPLWKFALPSPP